MRGTTMGIFSFFKKNKNKNSAPSSGAESIFNAVAESMTALKMMEEDKQKNGEQTKRNVVFQPEHVTIKANRMTMTEGNPGDYFFEGDEHNDCATLPLLSLLKIDIEKAIKDGIAGKRAWEGSKCMFLLENEEYRFYNYGCYNDGSGGCTVAQSKINPEQVLFFGKSRSKSCIYHEKLVQINNSEYGTELYLFVKDIKTGKERIYPWFGKYAIPTGSGSRYDQDTILDMRVDKDSDSIIIEVQRQYYINPSPTDNEIICNADTSYTMTVKSNDTGFYATAEFPELNVSVIFSDNN